MPGRQPAPSQVRLKASANDGKDALELVLRNLLQHPSDLSGWDEAERLCDASERPEPVAEAYLEALTDSVEHEHREALAQRAHAFYERWFGDDMDSMRRVLGHVLACLPDAAWAFDSLVTLLTVAGRWDDLLDAYELVLADPRVQGDRRTRLLGDAAHLAKDFADRPERALGAVRELVKLGAAEPALISSLSRTMRERGLDRALLGLWQVLLEDGHPEDPEGLRLEMAELLLERLDEPDACLSELRTVLSRAPGHLEACRLLERVLERDTASVEVRLESLKLLRLHHDSAARPEQTVAALVRALEFAPAAVAHGLRRELAGRLSGAGDDAGAMAAYAELLRLAPNDVDARFQLRLLAERSGDHERHAAALLGAAHAATSQAERAELLLAAMQLHAHELCQPDEAVLLGQRVLGLSHVNPACTREAALCVAQLLRDKDREAERLEALERLCAAEEHAHVRAGLAAEISAAHRALGESARALALWEEELARSPHDEHALGHAIVLCEELAHTERLVAHLRTRASLAPTPGQRRKDLSRAAELLSRELARPEEAVELWLALREQDGDDPEVLHALDLLLGSTGRYAELARILEGATGRERHSSLVHACRLGDVLRTELDDVDGAVRAYARALDLAPDCEAARRGLQTLVSEKRALRAATEALEGAYVATDDWEKRIDLLDARLSANDDAIEQATWMLAIAQLCEHRAKDAPRALSLVGRALTRMPLRIHVERDLLRLAELTGRKKEAAQALHWAAAVASTDRERSADLSALEARLLEGLGDAKGAADAYQAVVSVRPTARDDVHGLVRCAALAGAYGLACSTLVRWCAQRSALEPAMLDSLEASARGPSAYVATRDALRAAIRSGRELPAEVEAGLELRLAHLCLVHCDDLVGAEAALRRALVHRPGDEGALSLLAEVQRRSGSTGLFDTLLELDAGAPERGLGLLIEAARRLADAELEVAPRRNVLSRLLARATERWLSRDEPEAAEWVSLAVERLLALECETGRVDTARELADAAARLPFDEAKRVQLRVTATKLLAQKGDLAGALLSGSALLDARGADLEFVRFLAGLAATLERVPEELALRQRELSLVTEPAERLELRLSIVRLSELLEARDSRLVMLRKNLAEVPGHLSSLQRAIELLEGQRRHVELVSLLAEQASALVEAGEPGRAARLLVRAANVSERDLNELPRAMDFLERSLGLEERLDVLDELVRMLHQAGDEARTARWLGRKLALVPEPERPDVAVALARAQLASAQTNAAIATLRAAFERRPSGHSAAGKLLIETLRSERRDEELGDVLARLSSLVSERAEVLALAREAARLYHRALTAGVLSRPEALVEVADLALGLAPDDSELCSMAADALTALGRHGDARQVLVHSLHQFGRRRSPERALVHVQLARVYRAEGELPRACAELEAALAMRPDDPAIIDFLSQLAGEAGDLVRRERALRALYVCARRAPVQLADREVGVSEVLFLLSEVASQRGDEAQASSLRDSAMSALRLADPECARVKQALRERGALSLVERIVREELTRMTAPVERAGMLAELSAAFESDPARRAEAFALRLEAVGLDPRDPRLHEAALASARTLGELGRYRAVLETLRERLRRPSDALARCEVCLRLGALRLETADLAGAAQLFDEAEATQVREGDVWRAQLELAMTRADAEAQARLLRQLEGLGCGELEGEGRIELSYRLAEIRLGADDTRAEGIARMRDIVNECLRPLRAARIVLRARETRRDDAELLELLCAIAQGSGELDLVQVAELCSELGDDLALEVLLEEAEAVQRRRETQGGAPSGLRASLLVQRARLLSARGARPEQMVELLRKALALCPDDAEAETLLLTQYRALGLTGELHAHLSARFEAALAERDVEASARHVLALEAAGASASEVLPLLERALALAPGHLGLREAQLAKLRDAAPHVRAAALEAALEFAAMREPAQLAIEAAGLYRGLGDMAGATRALSLGRRRAPRNLPLLRALTEAVRELDLPEVLAELLEDLAREEPQQEKRAALLSEAARLRKTRLGDAAGALRLLERAVEARGNDASLRRALADELFAAGEPARAVEHLGYAAAHARTPTARAEHLRVRGHALEAAGDLPRALADLEEAHTLDAASSEASLERVLLALHKDDDRERARAAALRLVELYQARGQAARAVSLVESQLEDDPEDEQALGLLSSLYEQLDQVEPLVRTLAAQLERALEGSHAGVFAQKLAAVLPRVREPAFVRRALERAHGSLPDDTEIERALIEARTFTGDHRGVSNLLLARAERADQLAVRTLCLRGAAEHLLKADAVGEAAEVLVQLRAITPADVDTAVSLVDALLEQARFGDARLLLEAISERRPETTPAAFARVLVRLSRAARGQGDPAFALETLQTARDTDKSNRAIIAELAVLAEEQGAWDVAEKALTSLLLLNDAQAMPRAEILLRRARVARHHAGDARALMWAKKALEVAPGSAEVSALIRELEAAL